MMRRLLALSALAVALAISGASAQQAPPPACQDAAHRAFDFWIGEWQAYVSGTDTLAGRSTIRVEDGGCVITEHWRSEGAPFSGRSLNIYSAQKGHWEQFWVDSSGDITHFIGAPTADANMQLTAEDDVGPQRPEPIFSRMTFTVNADGSVRQHGEASTDRGATWSDRYDFTYRRVAD
ncbi:MAG: hypothetical protein AB7G05_14495 [Hyphomonadaceae bacterium]